MQVLKTRLPEWMQDWLEVIIPGSQILLILFAAWLLQRTLRRLVRRASAHYQLPNELLVPINGMIRWLIIASALLLILERMGVSATVLWTAFTGFATVGAVAFFAAWSVLSNLFCALLIFTVRPFRLATTSRCWTPPKSLAAKGRVVDINLLYTTLEDHGAAAGHVAWLQIPNALVFQRVVRRFQGEPPPTAPLATATDAVANASPAAPTPVTPGPFNTP